jgi:hypothetical protein
MIDYHKLLRWYMTQVYVTEGVTFIDWRFMRYRPDELTEEEWQLLCTISQEVEEGPEQPYADSQTQTEG